MDLDENTNVLDEVEILFQKLEGLPENIKKAAFNRIQQKLPNQEKCQIKTEVGVNEQKKRVGRKRKAASEENGSEDTKENVLTSRGRKAKRISYAYMHEFGKDKDEGARKHRKVEEGVEIKQEFKPTVKVKHLDEKDGLEEVKTEDSTKDQTEIEVKIKDIVNLENQNSEAVDDPLALDDVVIEKQVKITKGSASLLALVYCHVRIVTSSLVASRYYTSTQGVTQASNPTCALIAAKPFHSRQASRDYPCDYCEYKAYTKVDKLRHMTIHTGERNQICQYCGKAFAKDSTLREHVRSIHERPFKHICSECGFTTYRANNLRVHVRMRHRGEYNNHVCPVCGARVKQRNAFLEHMRAHTGEKPYRCDQCSSSFACLARLTVHRKSVHEPRQFPCTECRKTFQTKHHLLRHSVIHTKEKPFTCPFCTYSCNNQGNMTKHKVFQNKCKRSNSVYSSKDNISSIFCKTGRPVTLDELRERETEKQKRISAEVEQAKIKRLSRINAPEHSYHSRPAKVKLEEETVDPSTLILQVAAQNAESVTEEDQNNMVHVDLLPVIHIQTTDPLQTMEMQDGNGEYETVIFANGEDGEFVPAQVFELCLNSELMEGNAIQVVRPGLSKQEHIYDSEQPAVDFITNKEPDTVVVIINTEAEHHNP
ncbi:hypothetical protein C0J52_16042 [Blattella germanica]|nr:hypothetical protein C0J52_16042 [Blattella germanica]